MWLSTAKLMHHVQLATCLPKYCRILHWVSVGIYCCQPTAAPQQLMSQGFILVLTALHSTAVGLLNGTGIKEFNRSLTKVESGLFMQMDGLKVFLVKLLSI